MLDQNRLLARTGTLLGCAMAATVSCGGASAEEGRPADGAQKVSRDNSKGAAIGSRAPDFTASAIGSKQRISLRALRGQVVLVDFWGTFCEPCKQSFPNLQELSDRYGDDGFRIIGVSEDEPEDKDKIVQFAHAYGATFTLAWDADKSIARAYKPETMPTSFLIDKKGIVRSSHVGYHDGEEVLLEKEIQHLLSR